MEQKTLEHTEGIICSTGFCHNVRKNLRKHGSDSNKIIQWKTEHNDVYWLMETLCHNDEDQQGQITKGTENVDKDAKEKYGIFCSKRDGKWIQG